MYNTQTKTYCDLLHIDGKIDIHTRNIQILMTEIYKYLNKINPPFTRNYYNQKRNHYNMRGKHLLKIIKYRTKTFGLKTAVFRGAII